MGLAFNVVNRGSLVIMGFKQGWDSVWVQVKEEVRFKVSVYFVQQTFYFERDVKKG